MHRVVHIALACVGQYLLWQLAAEVGWDLNGARGLLSIREGWRLKRECGR
jgi:hypothetical protein